MGNAVYVLCAVASLGCAGLLARAWIATRSRLLLWSSVCFAALAVNSLLVVIDVIVLPTEDLRIFRLVVAVAGLVALVVALINHPQRDRGTGAEDTP